MKRQVVKMKREHDEEKGVLLNKTMDRKDLDTPAVWRVVEELFSLMRWMRQQGLAYSSWIGSTGPDPFLDRQQRLNRGPSYTPLPGSVDDERIPWFLLWEIGWLMAHTDLRPGDTVLDLGGSGSLFSSYLAWKGCRVVCVDINPSLVALANETASRAGWELEAVQMDMARLSFPAATFDHVFSVCVYEHLPEQDRIAANRRIRSVLKKGGGFSITFDYANPDRRMRIGSPEEVERQFIRPLGMEVVGNPCLHDNGKRYLFHPWFADPLTLVRKVARGRLPLKALWDRKIAWYTFASLFCRR